MIASIGDEVWGQVVRALALYVDARLDISVNECDTTTIETIAKRGEKEEGRNASARFCSNKLVGSRNILSSGEFQNCRCGLGS